MGSQKKTKTQRKVNKKKGYCWRKRKNAGQSYGRVIQNLIAKVGKKG